MLDKFADGVTSEIGASLSKFGNTLDRRREASHAEKLSSDESGKEPKYEIYYFEENQDNENLDQSKDDAEENSDQYEGGAEENSDDNLEEEDAADETDLSDGGTADSDDERDNENNSDQSEDDAEENSEGYLEEEEEADEITDLSDEIIDLADEERSSRKKRSPNRKPGMRRLYRQLPVEDASAKPHSDEYLSGVIKGIELSRSNPDFVDGLTMPQEAPEDASEVPGPGPRRRLGPLGRPLQGRGPQGRGLQGRRPKIGRRRLRDFLLPRRTQV